MEHFAKPGVAGIIEKEIDGCEYILIQKRYKNDASLENGLIEIPAGKIREFENIFDCLRREIKEETGLDVTEFVGVKDSVIYENGGYRVLNYVPFSSAQNLFGEYPIMVQTFICKVNGKAQKCSDEAQEITWMSLRKLSQMLNDNASMFYPMHVLTLKKYLNLKGYV